jgi:signal transduction histidine kinase
MLSQPRRDKVREADQPDGVLTTIFMAAREGILALDEIVWAVDPRHDTLDSLITYMSRYAQEYLNAANVRCRLDMPVEVPALPLRAELRHNLFLAYKEALNNTLKHAAATEVSISLKVEPRVFILEIVDNGRGFDRNQLQAIKSGRISAGNGLRNLERRLAAVGGRCEIATAEAEGTRVTFAVDISEQNTPPTS